MHDDENLEMIAQSLEEFGAGRSILIDEQNRIIAGNGTILAAERAGIDRVRIVEADGSEIIAVRRSGLTEDEKIRLGLFDNRAAEKASWDWEIIRPLRVDGMLDGLWKPEELVFLDTEAGSGGDGTAGGSGGAPAKKLAERFLVPPFSVLDARQGYWQDRKRSWIDLGIASELGRGENLLNFSDTVRLPAKKGTGRLTYVAGDRPVEEMDEVSKKIIAHGPKTRNKVNGLLMTSDSGNDPAFYYKKQQVEKKLGRELTTEEFHRDYYEGPDTLKSGTSIFDPVLCELVYRWFSPEKGAVLDPFAGGSVRGIVASFLDRRYTGVDLRPEQVEANQSQAKAILKSNRPKWITGDSRDIGKLAKGEYDLIFSCPPYFNLETYSDDPADISNVKSYAQFIEAYREIIRASVAMLKKNRFACFVVGDIRDVKTGNYCNFVSDTIAAFEAAGAHLYNEAILVTAVGSLALRAGRQFSISRKLGKAHQNVLVFVKGSGSIASKECGSVEVADPSEIFGESLEVEDD